MRDSLDFDALDDDEEAGNGKPPAYDPTPNSSNKYNNQKPDTKDTNSNMMKSQTLHDAEDTDDEDDLPLPAPTPQRPAQIASVQRGGVQERRDLDGEGEAMFSVGEDEEDADDVRGFSDSDEEGGGLVNKGKRGN